MEETITISAIARRAGVSRASVRAVLRDVFNWTPAHSQLAYQEGKKRGHLLQTVAGHPGLARGRSTLAAQGWPNLHRGHQTLAEKGYAGLDRGRATQASAGWPGLREERRKREVAGPPTTGERTSESRHTKLAQLAESSHSPGGSGVSSAAGRTPVDDASTAMSRIRPPRHARTEHQTRHSRSPGSTTRAPPACGQCARGSQDVGT